MVARHSENLRLSSWQFDVVMVDLDSTGQQSAQL